MHSWKQNHTVNSHTLRHKDSNGGVRSVALLLATRAESCYVHRPDLQNRTAAQLVEGQYYSIILSDPPVVFPPVASLLMAKGLIYRHVGIDWAPTDES